MRQSKPKIADSPCVRAPKPSSVAYERSPGSHRLWPVSPCHSGSPHPSSNPLSTSLLVTGTTLESSSPTHQELPTPWSPSFASQLLPVSFPGGRCLRELCRTTSLTLMFRFGPAGAQKLEGIPLEPDLEQDHAGLRHYQLQLQV